MPLPLYNYDNPQQNPPAAGGGSRLPLYDYGPIAPPPAPLPKKPGILEQTRTAASNMSRKVSEFIAGAAEAPTYTGAKGEVLRNLPGEVVRTIVPGAGALMDDPELAAQVSNKDILKELPGATAKVAGEMFVAPAASWGLSAYGAAGQGLNKLGLKTPGVSDSGAVNIKTPFGDFTNVQERIAQDKLPEGPVETALFVAKHTGLEMLNALYAASLGAKVVNPRISALTPKGQVNTGNAFPVEQAPKTFQYQEPKVYKGTVDPVMFEKIIREHNIPVRTNYNPKNPIFFQASNVKAGGQTTGQFFQVRPSYLQTFLNTLRKDSAAKPPTNQLIPVADVPKTLSRVAETPKSPAVIPPVPAVVPQTPVNTPPIQPVRALTTPEAPIVNPPQQITPAPSGSSQQYGPNDRIMLTDKATGKTAERIVKRVDGDTVVVMDDVSGIPYKASPEKFSFELVKKGDPAAPLPKTGITFGELAKQEEAEAAKGRVLTIKPTELRKEKTKGPGNTLVPVAEIKGERVETPRQLITKSDLKAAIKTYPGEKAEFTVREVDGQKRMELEAEGRKVSMRPSALGLVEGNIKVDDKVTITAKDLAPKGTALRAYDGEEAVASLASDLKEGVTEPAKSVDEMVKKIDQLNKFAQSQAILRRTGGLSTKWGGVFRSIPKDKQPTALNKKSIAARGQVHLQDSVVGSPRQYMETLAHELGHALDYTVNGSTSNTMRIFGKDLPAEVKKTILAELKANTNAMVGEAKAKAGAGYYYKPTELFARFLENMFAKPGQVEELAPTALKYLEESVVETPIIGEYLEAVYGRIDKGERKRIFLRDMKQTYQKVLGTRVGEMAWNDEMRYRAMKERAKVQVEKLIKAKFKNVKDDPETLFRAAESIKVTKDNAPVYGTRDFKDTKSPKEAQSLAAMGWEPLLNEEGSHVFELANGEQVMRFAKPRYSAAESKRIFESLSPEGQQLIKDFTAAKDEAKDYFNREMIKDVHKINTDLEGWVHRYWDDKGVGAGGRMLKTKLASAQKHRKGAEGYVEDLQKAMTKALTELETAKAYNAFIEDYFARVSKPIQKGAEADEGWVEVQGNVKKEGIALPGEVRRTVIEDGKMVPTAAVRYQMPAQIYKRFQFIREAAVEASTVARVMNSLNRYWRVNILFHPGSASTNLISGGIQYSTKILTDFYVEVLTGNAAFPKTRRNIFSMITAVTPKGWQDAPDWIYGGDLSNFYGQFGTEKTPGIKALDTTIDTYADNVLKVYGAVERYWKKVITLSEGGSKLGSLNKMTKEGLRLPTDEEKDLLDAMNKEIDLYGYDYENVPVWLESYQQSGLAQSVKPFAKYMYKYTKHLTELISAVFDGTLPWQERVAKLLTVMTIIAMYAAIREKRREKQTTAEVDINAPASVSTSGRLYIGTDEEGREKFTRTAKYPFLNVTEAGAQLLEGNTNTGLQVLQDMMGGIAPVGHLALAAIGYRSEYETYIPFPAMVGKDLASFVPGTRILADISKFYDPYQRKPETFLQGITSLYPTTDEALQEKLHGEPKKIQVPLEGMITPQPGEGTKRTTTDMLVRNYKDDVLLGLLFGLYVKRIDPDVAAAFVTRSEENAKEKEIKDQREALKKALTQ